MAPTNPFLPRRRKWNDDFNQQAVAGDAPRVAGGGPLTSPPMNFANSTAVVEERLPVWEALSEFFLDTELDAGDYDRIASVLAASPYSIQDIEDILRHEVYPVLIWNLRSVAGVWAGFDRDWLREAIEPRLNRRSKFRLPPVQWSMIREPWEKVSELIQSNRASKAMKKSQPPSA